MKATVTATATANKKRTKSDLISDLTLGVLVGTVLYQVGMWWMPSLSANPQRITVDLSDRTATTATGQVYQVAVGTPDNPTPTGEFVVREMDIHGRKNAVFAAGLLPVVNLGVSPFLEWGKYAVHPDNDGQTQGCVGMSEIDYDTLNLQMGDIVVIQP